MVKDDKGAFLLWELLSKNAVVIEMSVDVSKKEFYTYTIKGSNIWVLSDPNDGGDVQDDACLVWHPTNINMEGLVDIYNRALSIEIVEDKWECIDDRRLTLTLSREEWLDIHYCFSDHGCDKWKDLRNKLKLMIEEETRKHASYGIIKGF
jgi:hypothetical protein